MEILNPTKGYEDIESSNKTEKSFEDRWHDPVTQIGGSVSVVGTSATVISIGSVICGAIFMPLSTGPGSCCYVSAVAGVAGGLIGAVACGAMALVGAAIGIVGWTQN